MTLSPRSAFLSCAGSALTLMTPFASAQTVAGTFSPNPALPGEPVTLTVTDATGGGLILPSACGFFLLHADTPDGPLLTVGQPCAAILEPVAPHGSISFTWDQRAFQQGTWAGVPAGRYWFETLAWEQATSLPRRDFFCLSIQPAEAPRLTAEAAPRVGATLDLELSAEPGARYVMLAALTSTPPLAPFGLCLSTDALFRTSLRGGVFRNGRGVLDGQGHSAGIALSIPAAAGLAFRGVQVQALLTTATGRTVSNALALTLQP